MARHFAAVAPVFSALPRDLEIGYAPTPGHQRVFHPSELRRLAKTHGIEAAFAEPLCFEWEMGIPPQASLISAMRSALEQAGASGEPRIEIVESSRHPAPKGEIVFPLSGLATRVQSSSDEPVMWRGNVVYGSGRTFNIWARVKLAVPYTRVVTTEPLRFGEPVQASQVKVQNSEGLPYFTEIASKLEQVVGRVPQRSFPEGSALPLDMLEAPKDVEKGDTVKVEVRSGAARLSLDARAEAAGSIGDIIPVRNLSSGKAFPARIEAAGKVVVIAGGRARETSKKEN
ncbi:MAG: flagellar basal body P-ring formation chaperone FlgA [Bryobacteraceae bacterium]